MATERPIADVLEKLSKGVAEKLLPVKYDCPACRDTGFLTQRRMGSRGYEEDVAVRCRGAACTRAREQEAKDQRNQSTGDVDV